MHKADQCPGRAGQLVQSLCEEGLSERMILLQRPNLLLLSKATQNSLEVKTTKAASLQHEQTGAHKGTAMSFAGETLHESG